MIYLLFCVDNSKVLGDIVNMNSETKTTMNVEVTTNFATAAVNFKESLHGLKTPTTLTDNKLNAVHKVFGKVIEKLYDNTWDVKWTRIMSDEYEYEEYAAVFSKGDTVVEKVVCLYFEIN